jgi:hypothetical protein
MPRPSFLFKPDVASADRARVSLRTRIFVAAGITAVVALGAGFLLLGHGSSAPAAVPVIKPLHPVKHHVRRAAKKPAKATSATVRKKRSTPSVIDGMPASLALALRTNAVVVVALYAPKSSVDQFAREEAHAGASSAGAGFVALNVADEKVAAPLTSLLTGGATAADRVLDDPAVLVFQAPRTLFVRLNGYNDRETVAQAATNAGAVKVTIAASGPWATQANAICTQMTTNLLGLKFPTNASEAVSWGDQMTSVLSTAVQRLHALKAPRGREAEVHQLLSIYDQAVAALHTALAAIHAGNEPDVGGLQQKFTPLAAKAQSIARDLGATACAGSGASFGQ